MRSIMISGLPYEIHRDAAIAALDIMNISAWDSDEMHVDSVRTRGLTVYDAMYAIDMGGTLEITEKIDGELSREVSLRGVLSAAAAMVPAGETARLAKLTVGGPRILQGAVSFDPNSSRTLVDRLRGRESREPSKDFAEKVAADVISGFRRAFSRSPLAGQLHPDHR